VTMTDNMLDVLVVGAGQAGLAIGYYLAQQRSEFLIIDGAQEVGHSWRSRWDSLVLFTPAQFDNLPGMAFPAEADTYPTKDDAASYLGAYAERFALPVRLGSPVDELMREDDRYVATLGSQPVVVVGGANSGCQIA
jgi:putative flavoprotein involved in K+ transport